jgi:hypothetical protein
MLATSGRRCGGTIQEIKQQHRGHEQSHDSRNAVAGDGHDLIRPDPIADAIDRRLGDLMCVDRPPEQADWMIADRFAGEALQHPLQVRRDAPHLGDDASGGKGQDQRRDADEQGEQGDCEQQSRPPRAPRGPIQQRGADIGDDGGQHERQQNEPDEIEKDEEEGGREHDGARLARIEGARNAVSFGWPRLLVFPLGSLHE